MTKQTRAMTMTTNGPAIRPGMTNLFFYVFYMSEVFIYLNKIFFCLLKAVRLSKDALYVVMMN